MATGRTHLHFSRVYVDGYDMSGYSRSWGPLSCTFDEGIDDSLDKTVKAVMPGMATVSMGALNGLFDNTATSGLHVIMNGAGALRDVMVPIGIRAAPTDNDPVFAGQFTQGAYQGGNENPVTATIPFDNADYLSSNLQYARPWGVLLHARAAETGENSATGLDQAAQTTKGGWMMYQVFAGDGNAAIKVQDADTNSDGSFSDLLTSGSIDCSSVQSGVIALASTATVERYVRFQVALDTGTTTVTFALSWHRGL